jgi:DNA-directed RNA polymerase subunit RPC12/RpoP
MLDGKNICPECKHEWYHQYIIGKQTIQCPKCGHFIFKYETSGRIHNISINENGIELYLSGIDVELFWKVLVCSFIKSGATNFVTTTITHKTDKYSLTIQKCDGIDSPAEKIARLEKEILELKDKSRSDI